MDSNRHPGLMKNSEYEVIFFTYEEIEWIWNDGGITAMGTWAGEV
jgi:type VI secretion system secreted protein Hcp